MQLFKWHRGSIIAQQIFAYIVTGTKHIFRFFCFSSNVMFIVRHNLSHGSMTAAGTYDHQVYCHAWLTSFNLFHCFATLINQK